MMRMNCCRNDEDQYLTDDLLERIFVTALPFPSIFKARCLSKSWYARFSSIASQEDEARKRVAVTFQKMVCERIRSWKTFCPVFVGTKGDLVAYDKETHNWQKLPSVSFLPANVLTKFDMEINGALLVAYDTRSSGWNDEFNGEIYVANILTRAWKNLPPPPTTGCRVHSFKLVVTDRSSDTYKVILLCDLRDLYRDDFLFVQIYDSESDSWSSKKSMLGSYYSEEYYKFLNLNSVYLDGVLYMVSVTDWPTLWAFHLEQGAFSELKLSYSDDLEHSLNDYGPDPFQPDYSHLVVCDDKLLMVTGEEKYRNKGQYVLEIDFTSQSVLLMSTGPRSSGGLRDWSRAMAPVGDKCHIYFGYVGEHGTQMRAYNIKEHNEDIWSCSFAPPTTSADCKYNCVGTFQLGLRPFAAI